MSTADCSENGSTTAEHRTGVDPPLLEVQDLRTSFVTEAGRIVPVDGVSLCVPRGRTVALVGESGCGKSVTALSIMRLIPQPPGEILGGRIFLDDSRGLGGEANDGPSSQADNAGRDRGAPGRGTPPADRDAARIDLAGITERQMRRVRGNRIAMVFQDPLTALNPVHTVGDQIAEALELHQSLRGRAARVAAVEMLRRVEIPAPRQRARDYPHQLSGGMRQRVMIAMALSCRPSLLIADEPTTALDATIQLQILDLLKSLQAETRMGVLLITHDMGVVARIAEYIYVMYAGRIVEQGPTSELLSNPLHPYTQGLLRCTPRLSQPKKRLDVIPGEVPDPACFPAGCRFHPRCALSMERARDGRRLIAPIASGAGPAVLKRCAQTVKEEPSGAPTLREVRPGHRVACWEVDGPEGVDAP